MEIETESGEIGGLANEAAPRLRQDLKAALTTYASGKGDVEDLLYEIERIGQYITGKADATLGVAKNPLRRFVHRYAPGRINNTGLPKVNWKNLYEGVRRARNDLAHTGTEAALAGTRTATLATVLLEALANAAPKNQTRMMKDVMVSNPTCAQSWQTLADVRRTMLVNDFTLLPVNTSPYRQARVPLEGEQLNDGSDNGTWPSIRAEDLAGYLSAGDYSSRSENLGKAMSGPGGSGLVQQVQTAREDTPVENVWSGSGLRLPLVVTRDFGGRSELVGIVTAFDLL